MANSALSGNVLGPATATSPGIVSTDVQTFAGKKTLDGGALIKGDTSGLTISDSYVGQIVNGTISSNASFSTESYTDITTISIPSAGKWHIYFFSPLVLRLSALTNGTGIMQNIAITKNDNTVIQALDGNFVETGQSPLRRISTISMLATADLTGAETVKIRGQLWKWAGTETYTVSESIIYVSRGYKLYAHRYA